MKMESRESCFFVKGSVVEATSDLDGFRGAWFVARVMEETPNSLRWSRRTVKVLVEYQTLLSDDGSEPLREHVNFGLLRPLPPPHHQQSFEVNDVVEAYYNDGWWVGVVCQVWENPKAYSVLFDRPREAIKFKPAEVRVHLDWVGGKWVRPQKKIMQLKKVRTSSRKRKRGKLPQSLLKGKDSDGADAAGETLDDYLTHLTPPNIMQQKKVRTSSRKRKRGKLSQSLLEGKEHDGADTVDETFTEDCTTTGLELVIWKEPAERATQFTDSSSKAKDIEMAIVPSNKADTYVPTSMCPSTIVVDSSICGRPVDQSSEGEGRLHDVVQYDEREATVDNMPCKNQFLRFPESVSSILSFIQSMEVFQSMPQNPHFRPLNECNEMFREGLTIGKWLTFVKVAEQTSELQLDASRNTFNSIFECLRELESHGFDVKAIQSYLLELQSMKESQEQLQTKSEKFKCEIDERTCEETKIRAELVDAMELKVLEEKMEEVKLKRTRLLSKIEEYDSKITKLKLSDDLVKEEIEKVMQSFKSLAASPW